MIKTILLLISWFLILLLGATVYVQQSLIKSLEAKLAEVQKTVSESDKHTGGEAPYGWPFSRKDYLAPTSPFGERDAPFEGFGGEHRGVDLVGIWHSRIVSIADGVVLVHYVPPDGVRWRGHPIYGGMLVVRHDDGSIALYGHLSDTFVHEGDRVRRGQLLARQGDTGRARGEHLHLELWINGERVNPLLYMETP